MSNFPGHFLLSTNVQIVLLVLIHLHICKVFSRQYPAMQYGWAANMAEQPKWLIYCTQQTCLPVYWPQISSPNYGVNASQSPVNTLVWLARCCICVYCSVCMLENVWWWETSWQCIDITYVEYFISDQPVVFTVVFTGVFSCIEWNYCISRHFFVLHNLVNDTDKTVLKSSHSLSHIVTSKSLCKKRTHAFTKMTTGLL